MIPAGALTADLIPPRKQEEIATLRTRPALGRVGRGF
jgi:hypothetical protein